MDFEMELMQGKYLCHWASRRDIQYEADASQLGLAP